MIVYLLLKADVQPYKAALLTPTINNADVLEIVLEQSSKHGEKAIKRW
ncbi:MAG: hypothetical protein VXY53_05240 [Candidatus Thermoplasmatota archaeon]|nr:hypothetical protein [Candidatus Thermoplasmatota archaeon]